MAKFFKFNPSMVGSKVPTRTRPKIVKLKDGALGSFADGRYNRNTKQILLTDKADAPMRTHELTHWMQDRKGKYYTGKNPIRRIGNDLKNEAGAYYKQTQRMLSSQGVPQKSIKSKIISGTSAVIHAPASTFHNLIAKKKPLPK